MKFTSIFIKAATRKKRCLRRLQPLGSQRSAACGPKVYFRALPQNLNLYKELPCMERKRRFYRDNNPMARFFSYLRTVIQQ